MKQYYLASPEALKAFASRIAAFVSNPDFIALNGGLGAGKTTFAQGMLLALGVEDEITSPTYELVHAHKTPRSMVYHCDFYRLTSQDQDEIGLAELAETGVVVAEWASSIAEPLPPNRLDIEISSDGLQRVITLNGFGAWVEKLDRFELAGEFLSHHHWNESRCLALRGDASSRQFSRLAQAEETIIFMDWPVKDDGPPVKNGLPYCKIAHLARDGNPFLALGDWISKKAGLSAPHVHQADIARGFFLTEDLGDLVFSRMVTQGASISDLYALAVEGLIAIRKAQPSESFVTGQGSTYRIPSYDRDTYEIELELMPAWFLKLAGKEDSDGSVANSLLSVWAPYLAWLDTQKKALVLRDYHSPNLILCPDRPGLKRLGVIDFQDALWGHPAYDLVSLLQDARVDVPEEVEAKLYQAYCQAAQAFEERFSQADFGKAYAVLGAQRSTKILGIFARLSLRDGKHVYLEHLPRMLRYLIRNLSHPELEPLQHWYKTNLFDSIQTSLVLKS